MNLTRLAVQRPIGVTMLVLALVILGVLSLQNIGLDLLPRLEFPAGAIVTVYPGADPASVEESITRPLEESLATVPGLKRLRSVSMENASLIIVEFEWGANLDRAFRAVESQLEIARHMLPGQAQPPLLLRTDPSQFPIMTLAVSGGSDPVDLTHRVETYVAPRLGRVDGVASVAVLGGAREEISVRYDSQALADYGITPTLLYQVLALQNTVVPAGVVEDSGVRYQVRAGRRIESIEDLKQQPLALRDPTEADGFGLLLLAQALPVRLSDVATVTRQTAPVTGVTEVNGESGVVLNILKQSGENTTVVARRVRAALRELESDPDLGVRFHTIIDQSDLISLSLANVAGSAAWGAVLAVAVLLFFLRSFGALAIIAVSIPFSALMAVVILYASGTTLNLMSLGGFALAVGMLVDNAIVVIENVTRHRELGASPEEAAAEGGAQVVPAIVASTLTTLVVFTPITLVQNLTGQLLRDMAMAVCASIAASLVVAVTVIPSAAGSWLRRSRSGVRKLAQAPIVRVEEAAAQRAAAQRAAAQPGWLEAAAALDEPAEVRALERAGELIGEPARKRIGDRAGEHASTRPRAVSSIQALYQRALERWLKRTWPTVVVCVLMLVALIVIPPRLGSLFLPEMDGGIVYVHMTLPPGTTVEDTIATSTALAEAIRKIPEVETVGLVAGRQSDPADVYWNTIGPNEAELTVVLRPHEERERSASAVAGDIAALPLPDGARLAIDADRTAAALGDDYFPGLTLHITGPDLDRLAALSEEIAGRLAGADGIRSVSSSLSDAQPELFYQVTDRSFQGIFAGGEPLTAGQVGLALRNHLSEAIPTYLTIDGRRLPVVLRPDSDELASLDALNAFRVPGTTIVTRNGSTPPILDRIANLEHTQGPRSIDRLDRNRIVILKAELDGISLAQAEAVARSVIDSVAIPSGYEVRLAGIHQVIDESGRDLARVLLIAVAFVYIVMAVQFENWLQPLILMSAVPLAGAGAVLALALFGHPLSVPVAIGLILLIGVAVNNSIVMIDFINRLHASGTALREAVIAGAVTRLRPILMTSLTSIFGVIPLALSTGEGSEFQIPMAITVGGGLTSATFLSLFVLPGLLLLADQVGNRFRRGHELRKERTLGAALGLLLAAGAALGGSPAVQAHESGLGWIGEAAVTAVSAPGEAPALWLGAGVSYSGRAGTLLARIAGSPSSTGPRFHLQLEGSKANFGPVAHTRAAIRTNVWRDSPSGSTLSHVTQASLAWSGPGIEGNLWVARSAGAGDIQPWSGRFPVAAPGWQAGANLSTRFAGSANWDRSVHLLADEGSPPRWLLLSGPSLSHEIADTFLHAGAILESGRYTPLLRMGAAFQLLPYGTLDLLLAPVFQEAPDGWPVLGAGYQGPFLAGSLTARLELGAQDSGFDRRGYLRYDPPDSPFSLFATFTVHGDSERRLFSVQFTF